MRSFPCTSSMSVRVFGLAISFLPLSILASPDFLWQPGIVYQWDNAALQGVRDAKLGAPMVARALAIVHTCMYDAWAAYDERAIGTQLRGALRRPASELTAANKEKAISYAAFRALEDVLPVDTDSVYKPLMKQLGYDPNDNSADIETPAGIGNVACAAVLEFRHHDKSYLVVGVREARAAQNPFLVVTRTDVSVVAPDTQQTSWVIRKAYLEESLTGVTGYLEVKNSTNKDLNGTYVYAEYYDGVGRFCFSLVFSSHKNLAKQTAPLRPG